MRIDNNSPAYFPPAVSPAGDDVSVNRRDDGTIDAHATARKFEGLLLSNLVGQMREASGLKFFGETPGSQVFEGLFDQMFGESLAAGGGVGLSKQVAESMERLDEARRQAEELDLLQFGTPPNPDSEMIHHTNSANPGPAMLPAAGAGEVNRS